MEMVQKVSVDQCYFMHMIVANRNHLASDAGKTMIVPVCPSLS
jgi:hypothetical protein